MRRPERQHQFQFHKGTIKTQNRNNSVNRFRHFNSIKVRLKPLEGTATRHIHSYFNSIKVRLKHVFDVNTNAIHLFQFHKGTIKTCGSPCLSYSCSISIP